ncbi:MAG: hypothetical protein FJY77_01910 [Candidatus Altiarchaeales archaeon]|nr:hypothetical protein [Candidatus Altiarchaeales archaeon]
MDKLLALFFLTAFIACIFACGCADQNPEGGMSLALVGVIADKPVYHSAELLNITLAVNSSRSVQGVNVSLTGLNGRLNERKTMDLNEGSNQISIAYKLPRCNVCGGIKAGIYNITCRVDYENISSESSVVIDVQQ